MKTIFLSIFTISVLSLYSCNSVVNIQPSGNIQMMKKNCSSFQELEITGRFDVTVIYDNTESYEFTTDDNILPFVDIQQNERSIFISLKKKMPRSVSPIKMTIHVASLSKINLDYGVTLKTEPRCIADRLDLLLSNGSSFQSNIQCQQLYITALSGSTVILNGTTNSLDIIAKESSSINGFDLASNVAQAHIIGASSLNISVEKEFSVHASEGSMINYRGTPTFLKKIIEDGSRIEKR